VEPTGRDLEPRLARRGVAAVLAVQALLFVLKPLSGSAWSWVIFAPHGAEVAADLLPGGASPWDAYDGLIAGPLAVALLEAPLLALLGRVAAVHLIAMLGLSLAATWLAWRLGRRLASRRAGLAAALLVGLSPPVVWYHQALGAHHVFALVTIPAALLLLLPEREEVRARSARRILGWTLLFGTPVVAPSGIALASPLAGLLLLGAAHRARQGGAAELLRELARAVTGLALAAAPLLYKGLVHVPYGGRVTPGALDAVGQTRPLFVSPPELTELPLRLAEMALRDLPHGLGFGLHGLGGAGGTWVVLAGLAAGWLSVRWLRGDRGAWGLLLAVPPTVFVVGALTGWFVFHPHGREPFPREARHVLGLTWTGSMLLAIALDRAPVRARSVAWALVAAFALASAVTQLGAVRWDRLPAPGDAGGWRLEGRLLTGYFAGPSLDGDAAAVEAYCGLHPEPRRSDCLFGAALAWGERRSGAALVRGDAGIDPLRAACRELAGHSEELQETDCFVGLGFGLSHQVFREPGRALRACREQPLLRAAEREACVRGVGWGVVQDFWNRPAAMRRWLDEDVDKAEREAWARGVGDPLGRLNDQPGWRRALCVELVGEELAASCERAAR
jgi:hypothetical protein